MGRTYGKRLYPNGDLIFIDRRAHAIDRQAADRAIGAYRIGYGLYDIGACVLSDLQQLDTAFLRCDTGGDVGLFRGIFIVYFDKIACVSQGHCRKRSGACQKRKARPSADEPCAHYAGRAYQRHAYGRHFAFIGCGICVFGIERHDIGSAQSGKRPADSKRYEFKCSRKRHGACIDRGWKDR